MESALAAQACSISWVRARWEAVRLFLHTTQTMTELKEYSIVHIIKLLYSPHEYDGWGVNQRDPQIGDSGILIDILHVPNLPDKYVVENVGSDGSTIWLSDFFAEEIEPIDPRPHQ